MRFREFFIEETLPLRMGTQNEPTPVGYKRWGVEGKIIFAPAFMNGDQVSDAIEANPSVLTPPAQPNPQPSSTTEEPPPGHVLVRTPTGTLVYVKQKFTDGKGKLNSLGLELLAKQHEKLALAATTNVPSTIKGILNSAKQQADQYLGRNLSNVEWDALVRVANAEASHQVQEQGWVMAAVLNSVRKHNNTVYDEIMKKNRMQSVTGTKVDPEASPNFTQPPPTSSLKTILQAATSILPNVPKNVMHFTSANEVLYSKEKGTSSDWFNKLSSLYKITRSKSNPPGVFAVKVGGSIFSTDFDPTTVSKLSQQLSLKEPVKTPKVVQKPSSVNRAQTANPVKIGKR